MGKKDFDEFLEKDRANTHLEPRVDWTGRRDEWLEYLREFYKLVAEFLSDYVASGDVSTEYEDKYINEELVGRYPAQSLHLRIRGRDVILDPVGTNVIGARGRVDMTGPAGTVRFVLIGWDVIRVRTRRERGAEAETNIPEWVWKIATPPPRISYLDLNAESFLDALMEVINA
ncbi:MAG: hypothetical protein V1792_19365 [Pseudomonadota bacterium]